MAVEKIVLPDFGDVQEITVVEVYISPGDEVEVESPLIALESDKAVMDIPSPFAGVIKEILVAEDDQVKSGQDIATIELAGEGATDQPVESSGASAGEEIPEIVQKPQAEASQGEEQAGAGVVNRQEMGSVSHATPSVRSFAREQGIDLAGISGSGPKGRITKEDVLAAGKASPSVTPAASTPPQPTAAMADFTAFGEVEEVALGRIQKISGPHLHRSWIGIPHVTHFDEADLSDLEAFRKTLNATLGEGEPRYSYLAFIIKAVTAALKEFPVVNSSLGGDGQSLILKYHYHLGIAVDTPEGLVVPVIRDADHKGLGEIRTELAELSTKARAGKLTIQDLQGATFTISSLGGIGGTAFTPIISSPQVGILGLSRSYMRPVWDGGQFIPQPTLPFSFSYDHRVIDGANAARFCAALRSNIEDLKRTLI